MYVIENPLNKEIQEKFGGDDLGFIKFGAQETIDLDGIDLDWENLSRNRQKWLNIVKDHI